MLKQKMLCSADTVKSTFLFTKLNSGTFWTIVSHSVVHGWLPLHGLIHVSWQILISTLLDIYFTTAWNTTVTILWQATDNGDEIHGMHSRMQFVRP
jgi:hypothetical protein